MHSWPIGARLCAEHQPQRVDGFRPVSTCGALRLGLRPQPRSVPRWRQAHGPV